MAQWCSTWRPFASALSVLAASLLLAPRASAQQPATVRGTVVDSTTHRAIPGAQVTIVGTTRGTVTNDAGEYAIRGIPAGTVTLRAQRLGYTPATRELVLGDGASVTADFTLGAAAVQLTTVVSVGYGTAARQNVTSAIASVDSTAIANVPVAGIDNAIQGKVPGVQVMQNSGEPGSGISVRVRGPASLNAGNQPLYVVDGVPIIQGSYNQYSLSGQDMTAVTGINPDEIASIDVLKDAAAAAIYGSRGSNGVVLITTKRGSSGSTKFTLNSYAGSQQVEHKIGMLNAKQYVELMNEGAKNDGYTPDEYDFTPGVDDAQSYDWQDAVFRRAPVSDAQLSASGGADRLRYYVSAGNFDQTGIVIGSRYQRQSARVNLDATPRSRLSLSTSIGLTREDDHRIPGDQSLDGVVTNAIGMQPMRPIYGSSYGFGGDAEGLRYSNPVAIATFDLSQFKTLRALGKMEARLGLTDKLWVTGRAGADVYGVDELAWSSPKVDGTYAQSAGGVGRTDHTTATRYLLEGFANYDVLSTPGTQLSLTGGSSVEYNHDELEYVRGEGFPTGFTKYIRNAANVTVWDGSASDNNLVSFFTRANLSLRDRYLFSASLRTDGSSRFGSENRYGVFPSASLGWMLTQEGFAQGLARYATVKLRASYGVTGNQGIGDYASRSLAGGVAYSGIPGVAGTQLGNPDLKWETTRELDLGTDVTLFDNRVGLIADWYNRRTNDLLVQLPVPATSGYSSIWNNIGSIRNRGFDLGLHTENLRPRSSRGLGWSSDLNLTWNSNEVTSLYAGQRITFTVSSRVTSVAAVGQPLGEFYLYKFLRVDPQTGNAVYATADGGESMTPTSSDLAYVGNPQPKYYGGFTNTFTWGPFDLRAFLPFSRGGKVFNMMRIFMDDGAYTYDNKSTLSLKRWQKPGDITDEPRASYDGTSGARLMSSRMVEDASYVRLGELTLGYRVPDAAAARIHMNDARLYVSGRNLHTWTKYSGYNPDVNSAGVGSNVVMGVDYYAYPLPRTITIGLSTSW